MLFNKNTNFNDPNGVHVLYINSSGNAIKIGKLTYYSPDYNYDKFNWYRKMENYILMQMTTDLTQF